MPDREKILHELDHQVADADWCDNDWKDNVPIWMLRGALAMLREQEPIPPDTVGAPWWRCGNCGGDIVTEQFRFCPWCGKAVKWDADD